MAEKRGTVGGMPSRVKLPPYGISMQQAVENIARYQQALALPPWVLEMRKAQESAAQKRPPTVREAVQNAARNIRRLGIRPPY
jgi:hypothetical protein